MSRTTYSFLIVAAIVLAACLGGRLWAVDVAGQPALERQYDATRRPAFLTAELADDTLTTLHNPRAGQGVVFYVTDVFCENRMWLRLPPELGGHEQTAIILSQDGPRSFRTPLPLVTSIEVRSDEGVDNDRTIVFAGYYDNVQPFVESMPTE